MELEALRKEIDLIDKELAALLTRRMDIVEAVARYKMERGLAIFHPEREEEVLEKNLARMDKEEYKAAYRDILLTIMETSRRLQGRQIYKTRAQADDQEAGPQGAAGQEKSSSFSQLLAQAKAETRGQTKAQTEDQTSLKEEGELGPVGYQGIPGSYSHEALLAMVGQKRERVSFPRFPQAVQALEKGEVEALILPIENSSMGGVKEVEELICSRGLYITGEYVLPIQHALLGPKGSRLADLEQVYSHSQALGQCQSYLREKSLLGVPYYNTAMSAKKVSEEADPSIGAIASLQAARLYDLSVLEENIGDNGSNHTRFVKVKRKADLGPDRDKISIRISMAHQVGALYRIVNLISESQLNMTRIESRPIFGQPWHYYFYIDLEGNVLDPRVEAALARIQDNSADFIFLGNYRRAR